MMIKKIPKALLPFVLAAAMMAGCQKEHDFPEPGSSSAAQGIVGEAKDWFDRARSESPGGELDFGGLQPDWAAHSVDRNKAGQPVLTVPVANRIEPGREYMELAYVADGRGGVGVVKHYVGDLANGESVGLKFYDALGRVFVQGRYDAKTGMFSPIVPLATKKGKLNKIASLSGSGNSTSEEPVSNPDSPIVIDEVTVTAPAPNHGGGGDWGGGSGGSSGDSGGWNGGGGSGVPVIPGGGWSGGGGSPSGPSSPSMAVAAPDVPINLQDRLNCFNTLPSNSNTVYKVTLHVDRTNNYLSTVGHTFIMLEKSNGNNFQRLSYGFYPQNGLKSTTGQPVSSKMGEESGDPERESDIRYTINVSEIVFQNAIAISLSKASKDYELYNYNCTHYALDVFNTVLTSDAQLSGVSTPNRLYGKLNSMSNSGIHRNKIKGNNLPKSTNCN